MALPCNGLRWIGSLMNNREYQKQIFKKPKPITMAAPC